MSNQSVWQVIGFAVKTFQAAQGQPQRAGACCDKCGQSIKYVVTLRDQNGSVINVGRDCAVTLEGGPELAAIRQAERAYNESVYRESPEYQERLAHAKSFAERKEAIAAEAEVEQASLLADMRFAKLSKRTWEGDVNFLDRCVATILQGYGLEEKELARVDNIVTMAYMPEPKCLDIPAGSKFKVRAMLAAMAPFATQYGKSYFHKFIAEDGSTIAWFSTSYEFEARDVGQWHDIVGTVKTHGQDRDGNPQSVVTRVKKAHA